MNRLMIVLLTFSAGCAAFPDRPEGLRAGQELEGPWWMQQTAMDAGGRLDLRTQPWWPRAEALQVDEEFLLDIDGFPGAMLVRRERVQRRSGEVEAIVWIIDDDLDGSARRGGDKHADCYVVDYGPNGLVDRIVDYIDNDGDGIPNEMDIRYFEDGELRYVWCGMDLDGDGHMWDLKGYEYSHDFFASDPYGDNMIYMNKFDPERGEWVPISECPFAFYDLDGDGYSEVAVRVSASPLDFDPRSDVDYANDYRIFRGPFTGNMRRMGVMNVRYSFDIENLAGPDMPLNYNFGFNMVGAVPYDSISGVDHFNPRRRPPQVTRVIPFNTLRRVADTYPADETGFTWHEQHDDTISIGYGPFKDRDFRWEGVFWIWERRFMANTGGPGQKWNVRREWSRKPANRRELYYSAVDRRIHLFGAEEGWIEIGHFGGQGRLGEIRMFDTDGNGYFDRWEVYWGDDPVPVRVTTVRDERARRIPFEDQWLHEFYTGKVLPEAMAANEQLMKAMARVRPFDPPAALVAATENVTPNHRRYTQDVIREMQYQDLRQHLMGKANGILAGAPMDDLRRQTAEQRDRTRNSQYAWRLIRALGELDVAYGQGYFEEAEAVLVRIAALQEGVE